MATKTMTRAQAIAIALEEVHNPEALEVLGRMYDQLTKPKAASTGKTKAAIENEAVARKLYEIASGEPFDSRYVMEHTLAMTPQKVVGIMKVGIALGLFERLKDGKRTVYRKL